MPTPIRYPDVTGYRASGQSVILKLDNQEFVGWTACEGEMTRERVLVYGANSNPIGKTRGKTTLKASVGVYVAEFNTFIVQHFGPGWGDRPFSAQVLVNENGFDTIDIRLRGCTIDVMKFSFASDSSDPLKIEGVELNPIGILWNGVEMSSRPLRGATAIG